MKALPLLACLALLAPQAFAQPAPATREATLGEINAWRQGQLVHVTPPDPLTAEFEPRLDEIETAVKAAQAPDDLAKPQKDFTIWQHDLLMKKFVLTKIQGTTRGSLDRFSQAQREQIRAISAQNNQLTQTRLRSAQTFDGGGTDADAVGTNGSGGRTAPSPVNSPASTPGLRINAAPLPPPTAKPLSLSSLRNYFDRSGISDAVLRSIQKIKDYKTETVHMLSGFMGECYYGVKWMLIKTHVLPPEVALPEEIDKIGIGSGNADDMSRALKHNPKLQAKLHVRPLDLTTVKDTDAPLIPERTMFVFDRGCAGFSSDSGHIEYTLLPEKVKDIPASAFYRAHRHRRSYKPSIESNEVLACSDGCMIHTMAYLRTYGRKGCLNAYVPVSDRATAPAQTASADAPVEIPAAGR